MLRIILMILCAGFLTEGCKKEAVKKTTPPADTTSTVVGTFPAVPSDSLRGVNWACDGDNFSDGILVLSGLTSSDSYTTVTSKANAILSGIQTITGANTVRIPINYPTATTSWWSSYTGVI